MNLRQEKCAVTLHKPQDESMVCVKQKWTILLITVMFKHFQKNGKLMFLKAVSRVFSSFTELLLYPNLNLFLELIGQ